MFPIAACQVEAAEGGQLRQHLQVLCTAQFPLHNLPRNVLHNESGRRATGGDCLRKAKNLDLEIVLK